MTRLSALVLVLVLVLVLGCPDNRTGSPTNAPSGPLEGDIRVLCASSLATPLTALGSAFEKEHPGVSVKLSFGSSTAHERQIEAGAPCDLLIAASQENVNRLGALVGSASRTVIARNELAVIVPAGQLGPEGKDALARLPRVAIGARGVPVGEYAREALDGLLEEEQLAGYPDEAAVVTAVAEGGAPAGIGYRSSIQSHPARAKIAPAPVRLQAKRPIELIALLARDAKNRDGALAFLIFIAGPRGKEELKKNGFLE